MYFRDAPKLRRGWILILVVVVPAQAQRKDEASPKPTKAPFNAKEAKDYQRGWARHLKLSLVTRNSIGMRFVVIPPGEFVMGSPSFEEGRQSDESQHRVKLTKPFLLSANEVTQAQFVRIMRKNPSTLKIANHPVEKVTWTEAVEFCARLSDLPAEKRKGRTYRLPTEAEWEYACRAGSTTAFSFGEDQSQLSNHGWWKLNSGDTTHPVGQKKPNPWGLYDLHGNVFELCRDRYGDFTSDLVSDPTGPTNGRGRVFRGGSWYLTSGYCRSTHRNWYKSDERYPGMGFRVLRTIVK